MPLTDALTLDLDVRSVRSQSRSDERRRLCDDPMATFTPGARP
jgi:hypothetical protein